jgi:hypothetical protein
LFICYWICLLTYCYNNCLFTIAFTYIICYYNNCLLVVALLDIIGAQFMLASKLHAHFTSSPMDLITINVAKCLQLANLSWMWSCMNLLSILCKESNLMATWWKSIEGYGKLQGLVWPSFCSRCNWLHTNSYSKT